MGQITAFSSDLDITFDAAIAVARTSFPDIDFTGVNTKEDLEAFMSAKELVLHVEIDRTIEVKAMLENEKKVAADVASQIGPDSHFCPPDLPTLSFSDADLEGQDFCLIPEAEFPPAPKVDPNEIAALEATIADIMKSKSGSLEDPNNTDDNVAKIQGCIAEMQDITDQLNILLKKESDLRILLINLEEILYNYRIMDGYFGKRLEVMNNFLKLFDPLIIKKNELEQVKIPEVEAKIAPKQSTYDTIVAKLADPAAILTAQEQALYTEVNTLIAQRTQLNNDLTDVKNLIALEKGKIAIFGNNLLHDGTDIQRKAELDARLDTLFNGATSSVYAKVSEFSTRTNITPTHSTNFGQAFKIEIKVNFSDPQGFINYRPKNFLNSDFLTTVTPPIPSSKGAGILYDKLYNVWGDIELFFTPEERGLTANSNFVAPEVKDTGAEVTNAGLFISNLDTYEEFYTHFQEHHKAKTDFVKSTFVEPKLTEVIISLEAFAIKEVEYLLSFGMVFQDLPANSAKLGTVIQNLIDSSALYHNKVKDIRDTYLDVSGQHDQVLIDIEKKKNEYSTVSCAAGASPNDVEPPASGADPLGKISLQQIDPKLPDPTKFCYWKRFAKMASAVNLLPLIPRYWPIGLLIPSPNGVIRIPLPIVWIPIAVIPLPIGVFVIFIGLCGICPSPFVLYLGPQGEKKFIISLRPTQTFGWDASQSVIKTVQKGGIAINKSINSLLNLPQFPPINDPDSKSTVLDDIEDKIIKKVRKLPQPNVNPMRSLPANATLSDKKDALRKVMSTYLKNLDIPDFKLPKNGSKVNPKPPPTSEIIDTLKKSSKQELPQISIPSTEKLNLTSMLITEVKKLDINKVSTPPIEAPPTGTGPQADVQKKKYLDSINQALSAVAGAAVKEITPQKLGILAQVSGNINFFNAYICRPTASGIRLPSIPGPAVLALGTLRGLSTGIINGLTVEDIFRLNGGPVVSKQNLQNLLVNSFKALPNVEIPNPSKISIKDMLKESSLKMTAIQLPSLPDPTKGIQIRLNIPGAGVKGVIVAAVDNTINALPTAGIDAINFQTVTPVDMKQIATSIIENSFKPLENFLNPFLNIISGYKDAKDKTFPEILGLPKVAKDDTQLPIITKQAMDTALQIIDTISLVPYPAVAVAPDAFKHLHPVLEADDLPPWERLSMKNFLFIVFLDQFCHRGKQGGGFFENP